MESKITATSTNSPLMSSNILSRLGLFSAIGPYYGYFNKWKWLLLQVSKKSYNFWAKNKTALHNASLKSIPDMNVFLNLSQKYKIKWYADIHINF